ncbi:hypothetical protein [Streptomyces sp. NPDC093149]|uniref:hypothetical protein n=1 Tax=Streptomyces sp. NPDC093149 TaxID=3366031 RepID=UPI003802DB86
MLAWAPYGRRGIFGGFEGESEWNVLRLGLPVMILSGIVAGLTLFALVQRKWRPALGRRCSSRPWPAAKWRSTSWTGRR